MTEDITTLINKFETAVQAAWIYDTKLGYDEFYNPSKLNKADLLFQECSMVKVQLLMAVKALTKENDQFRNREIAASWESNPDRMGGQFTQQEIDEAHRGGHGW